MSNQPREQGKAGTKPEQKTDATAILSPEELRAISGGAGGVGGTNPTNPVGNTGPNVIVKKG
jgi:hypothetical protein